MLAGSPIRAGPRPAPGHVAQKWEPVLRCSDMRNQKVGVGRVNADEGDPLWPVTRGGGAGIQPSWPERVPLPSPCFATGGAPA